MDIRLVTKTFEVLLEIQKSTAERLPEFAEFDDYTIDGKNTQEISLVYRTPYAFRMRTVIRIRSDTPSVVFVRNEKLRIAYHETMDNELFYGEFYSPTGRTFHDEFYPKYNPETGDVE